MWMLFKGPQRSSRWLEPEKSAWLLTTTSFRRLDHRRIPYPLEVPLPQAFRPASAALYAAPPSPIKALARVAADADLSRRFWQLEKPETETFRPLTFPVAIRHRRTGSSRLAATSTRAFQLVLLFT